MDRLRMNFQSLRVPVTMEEILADLSYPARRPRPSPARAAGRAPEKRR